MVETAARDSGFDQPLTMAKDNLAFPDLASAAEKTGVDWKLFDRSADLRWLKRRVGYVIAVLSAVAGLLPETFGSWRPTLASSRAVLGGGPLLVRVGGAQYALGREVAGKILLRV